MTPQDRVELFMRKAEQECPRTPQIPDANICKLRTDLIQEELDEFTAAWEDDSLIDAADALADLMVVVLGSAVAFGMKLQPLFDEVMSSNLSKFEDGYKAENGKWIKGPSYKPAQLKPILWDQMHPE